MSQVDPWEKAADCERAIQTARDPRAQDALKSVQKLWIALANKQCLMTTAEFASQVEATNRLQVALTTSKNLH